MTILSDKDIKKAMQAWNDERQKYNVEQVGIKPFDEKNLTPNGYDLSIAEVYIKEIDSHIKEGTAVVPPYVWFAISTKEFVKLGRQITAQLWIRSSYARKGVLASFGKVDAGFNGTLTFGCFNASDEKLEIPIGDRFCQIVFELLSTPAEKAYDKRSGNYQDQRGVTLEHIIKDQKNLPTATCQHGSDEDCMICVVCGQCREDLDSTDTC